MKLPDGAAWCSTGRARSPWQWLPCDSCRGTASPDFSRAPQSFPRERARVRAPREAQAPRSSVMGGLAAGWMGPAGGERKRGRALGVNREMELPQLCSKGTMRLWQPEGTACSQTMPVSSPSQVHNPVPPWNATISHSPAGEAVSKCNMACKPFVTHLL